MSSAYASYQTMKIWDFSISYVMVENVDEINIFQDVNLVGTSVNLAGAGVKASDGVSPYNFPKFNRGVFNAYARRAKIKHSKVYSQLFHTVCTFSNLMFQKKIELGAVLRSHS